MNTVTLYVPRDSAALAVGADAVARRIAQEAEARGLPVHIVRNGSRGLFWLEPLVEVATPAGRVAYEQNCSTCHGTNLRQLPEALLAGREFVAKWGGRGANERRKQ